MQDLKDQFLQQFTVLCTHIIHALRSYITLAQIAKDVLQLSFTVIARRGLVAAYKEGIYAQRGRYRAAALVGRKMK